jgi:hypothetical protein
VPGCFPRGGAARAHVSGLTPTGGLSDFLEF